MSFFRIDRYSFTEDRSTKNICPSVFLDFFSLVNLDSIRIEIYPAARLTTRTVRSIRPSAADSLQDRI